MSLAFILAKFLWLVGCSSICLVDLQQVNVSESSQHTINILKRFRSSSFSSFHLLRGCVKLELEATSTRVSLVGRDPHPTNRQDFWRCEWRDFDQQQAERCAGGTGRGC